MSIEFDATTVQPTGSSVAVEDNQTVPVNQTPAEEADETIEANDETDKTGTENDPEDSIY